MSNKPAISKNAIEEVEEILDGMAIEERKKSAEEKVEKVEKKKKAKKKVESSSSESEDEECPHCGKETSNLEKHLKKCKGSKKKSKEKIPSPEQIFASKWCIVDNNEDRSRAPPNEVNLSHLGSFSCRWGCVTGTGRVKAFQTKRTFLEHILMAHESIQIAVETPPVHHPLLKSDGTRYILNEMDLTTSPMTK